MLRPGDLLFKFGKGFIALGIKIATRGRTSHVGIMYNDDTIFETDGSWGKAEMHPIDSYKGKKFEIYRYKGLSQRQKQHVRALCEEYKGTPYSYWDVAVKGLFFWLPVKIRSRVTGTLGNTEFMICNELTMKIMYVVTGDAVFKDFEGSNPSKLRKAVLRARSKFDRIV